MIKTEHDKVLTLYCQDQKIITNGKLLRVELGLPYQIMSFRYVGESSTEYTRGDFYNVIDCGPHWHTNEIVVWVTNNGHPETTDVNYCTAFSFDTFLSDFEYDIKYLELMNKVEKLQEQINTAKKALKEISEDVPKPPKYNLNAEFWRTQWSEASGAHLMEYLRAEKLKKDNEILKKALTNIKLRTERDELETYYVERNHDIRKDAIDALAAIGNEGIGDE